LRIAIVLLFVFFNSAAMKRSTFYRIRFQLPVLIIAAVLLANALMAQEAEAVAKEKRNDYKNVVKLNLSSRILYDNSFLIGYERVIKKNQSISISGGYLEFPVSLNVPDFLKLDEQRKKSGYTVTVDWRFYLAQENKYSAPHGIYLAPFIAVHHFQSDRNFTYTDTTGAMKDAVMSSTMNFLTIGGQLGYQFVIKRRFVIDAVLFGPGISNYYFKCKLNGNLSEADKETIAAKVIEALKEKLPLLEDIASGKEVSSSGVQTFWSVGFRYSLSIGFRF
jgi:hypothetical protein